MTGLSLAATLRRRRQGGGGYTLRFLSEDATTQTFEVNVPDPHLFAVSRGAIIETYRLNPTTTTFVSEDADTITVEV